MSVKMIEVNHRSENQFKWFNEPNYLKFLLKNLEIIKVFLYYMRAIDN